MIGEMFDKSINVTKFDKTRLPHTSTFMTLKHRKSMFDYAISYKFKPAILQSYGRFV